MEDDNIFGNAVSFNNPSLKAPSLKDLGRTAGNIMRGGQIASYGDVGMKSVTFSFPTNREAALDKIRSEKKPTNKLESRIANAKAAGKDAKAARLQGKSDRRDVRDAARAERIKQRNVEQLAKTEQRQENKNERFARRREGGNVPVSSAAQVISGSVDKFKKIAKTE